MGFFVDRAAGNGLPPQWTDGGNGDVTATVDDVTKTPITLEGTVDHESPLLLIDEPDDGSNYSDVVAIVGDKGGPNESNIFTIDSAGQFIITTQDVGASALIVFPKSGSAAYGAHIIEISTDGATSGTLLDLEASGKFSVGNANLADGLLLHGPHAAPADAAMNSGDLMLWFDQTNGAAKLMLKGKSANGTVVTGEASSSVFLTSKTLTAAQILDLNNTPIELIPAPTGRKYIWPLHMVFHGRPGGTPFSGGVTPGFTIGWTTDYNVPIDFLNTSVVQGAGDLYHGLGLVPLVSQSWESTVVEATPLLLYGVGQDAVFPSTDWLTAGNGTLSVRTWYTIIDGAPPA